MSFSLAMPSLISDFVGHLAHIGSSSTPSTVADLQFLANSLSETLSEKDTALQHLRSANKYVCEGVELKITLIPSGNELENVCS